MSKQTIKETIDSLRGASTVSTAWGGLMAHAANLLENTNREAKVWNHAAQAKQARIDALMLEYCPDEMTPEQLKEWGDNQVEATEKGVNVD